MRFMRSSATLGLRGASRSQLAMATPVSIAVPTVPWSWGSWPTAGIEAAVPDNGCGSGAAMAARIRCVARRARRRGHCSLIVDAGVARPARAPWPWRRASPLSPAGSFGASAKALFFGGAEGAIVWLASPISSSVLCRGLAETSRSAGGLPDCQ